MKHTPAPWTIRKLGPAEHYAIEGDDNVMIASTAVGENTKADAYVIAAAPKLLAALKLALPHTIGSADPSVRLTIVDALAAAEPVRG